MIRIIPLVAVLAVSACSNSAPVAASSQNQQGQTATPAAPATAAPGGAPQAPPVKPVPADLPEVVARVNGQAISRTDLEKATSEIEARAGQPMPANQRDRVLRAILDQLIGFRLLAQESAARKITVTDADVDARVNLLRQRFPTEEAFQEQLTQRQISMEKLRADTRVSMQITAMLQAELGAATGVTEEQINDFYAKNPGSFQQGERVRASHILVRVEANADPAAREKARAKAASILADVKAGKDFAALAKQYSDDSGSGAQGGDVGFFERGQMVPAFERAAFAMKPGQTSELVLSDFGYHIIRVTDRQAGRTQPLADVRANIERLLVGRTRELQTRQFVESLKTKGKVEILI